MGLLNLLSANRSENLFLPAHGRGNALPKKIKNLLKLRPGIWDLPELFEIGGPLISEGAIAESQKSSAYEVGVDRLLLLKWVLIDVGMELTVRRVYFKVLCLL